MLGFYLSLEHVLLFFRVIRLDVKRSSTESKISLVWTPSHVEKSEYRVTHCDKLFEMSRRNQDCKEKKSQHIRRVNIDEWSEASVRPSVRVSVRPRMRPCVRWRSRIKIARG